MMSLSKNSGNHFEPLAIGSLERFDDEVVSNADKSAPDFERFKLLFDEPKFQEDDESIDFKALFEENPEKEEVIFEALPGTGEALLETLAPETAGAEILEVAGEVQVETLMVEVSPEEEGFREGLQKGLEEGRSQGSEQGYEEGFAKGKEEGTAAGEKEGLEKGHAEGFEKGLLEGRQKGEEETKEEAVKLLTSLEETLHSADQTLELLVDTYEERIIDLIQKIVEKIIAARLEIDDEAVKPMILDALKTLVQPEEITLNVSTQDYEYIEMVKDEFFEEVDSLTRVGVRSDPSLQKGNFNIETSTGMVSSDLDSRLEAVFEAVKNAGRQRL